ncbi:DUF427 domain-containing protein [Sulfitobacter sp. CW3]|uniref:DUF427 domain-containing protein n=1 Tax=Sulfitobacter sp. CW3 TaxID=2861965 RepID=UPI001C5DAC30|nr:DUF427 domain-containing protein [Sulfitobacter sp. CW3]MBW4960494.1 DUF427 domain-containing protein [Sulfitobacter sp. CW3]
MSDHIKILKADGTWTVRAGGAVLAETKDALELREGDRDAVIYIPRGDIAMAFLDKTDKTTHCPHKGDATYYSVVTKSRTLQNVAWSYEDPSDQAAEIKGHLAFYNLPEVTVEQI